MQFALDVVIPAHEKDIPTLNFCIAGIKKNVKSLRRIIVISKEKYTNQAERFDESLFPFSYKEISDIVDGSNVGWNYQQLLKLYSPLVIPNILPNVLIVDSDTVFFRKVEFFSKEGLPLYNLSKDLELDKSKFQQITLKHIKKIAPEIIQNFPKKFENISGICHHMLFQKHIIEELFAMVCKVDGGNDPFYKIFLKNAENSFGVAEYNLYFYFLISLHPNSYKIRILKYKNTSDFSLWKYKWRFKYHYCSFHSYMRENQAPQVNIYKKITDFIQKKIDRLFFLDQWNIGILNFPIHEILTKNQKDYKISWFKNNNKLNYKADPFGLKINDQQFIIFEEYPQLRKRGIISIAPFESISDGVLKIGKIKNILDNKKHLSYPFIINHEDKIFMICESSRLNNLSLYEIDKKDLTAKKIRDIFTNKKIIDPTIIFHQNKFWLFYSLDTDADSNLHIAFANSLFDEFKQHPKNPVKRDSFSARSAGTPFIVDGVIYRPAQNCKEFYGLSVVISRITELNEESFSEEFVKEITPTLGDEYDGGLHTISEFGNFTLVDGKRKVFVFYKIFISLIRNFTRALK